MAMTTQARLVATLIAVGLGLAIVAPASACEDHALRDMAAATPQGTASAIVPGAVGRTSLALRATYDVTAKLGFASRAFSARTTITVTNTSGGPIDRLELNTVAARLGTIHLWTVTVDGRSVAARISDQTIVVPLGGQLPAGATATIRVPYSARLRSTLVGSSWMFTRANGIASIYRWIPWISRATPFSRPNHGDPFVTPASPRVTVRLATDRYLPVASTGERVSISADRLIQTFRAENVRDFVLSAAPDYRFHDAVVGDNVIRVAARPGAPATAMLAAARLALTRLERLLGPYPYRLYTVAQSAGGFGMEGPGTTWIPTGIALGNLRYLVAHETAHQWFYGIVGNDQARRPFADEAAADFVARYALGLKRGSGCSAQTLDRSIYRYTALCYYEVIYIQGGNVLDSLRQRMGSTRFWGAIRRYLGDHRFGLSSTKTLLDALDAATPLSFSSIYRSRFPSLY